MVTTAGQRFVRRHDAARSSTANGTAADIGYDTAVLSEGGYSWSSPEVTVDTAGKYLTIFDIGQCDLASTRAVGTLVPSVNTTDQNIYRARHRYLRNSGGQHGASIGMCVLDLAANDDVKVRNPGALTPTDAAGNYATNASYGGGLQLLYLGDPSMTEVQRTTDAAEVGTSNINATRPWLVGSGTWTKITYNSEVIDDDGLYGGSGGDLTLAANKKYLIVWGATIYSTDASRHTNVVGLNIDGDRVQTGTGYHRNTGTQGPPMCGMYLHETGGSTETLYLEATHETEGGDAGTPNVSDAYLQVITLPDTAEWIHVDNGTTDSLTTALAGTSTWYDTPLSSTFRSDGNSNLSLDSGNDAVQNDSGGSLPVLAIGWHRWDRDAGSSGTRKMPWTRWDNGGSAVGYGISGAFSRGAQSSDDTWQAHYCAAALLDLANAADLSFQVNDEPSGANSDMGIYASTSRYFLGVQVLDLDTLTSSAPTITDVETDEDIRDGDTAVTITGTTYEATQGTGKVELASTSDYATATKVTQTIESWADTAIDITTVLGALTPGTLYMFVTNDSGDRSTGFAVTVRRKIPVRLTASTHITAGGEAITDGLLTAPAGKTEGADFGAASRAWDDENGSDSINIGDGEYVELVWNIEGITGVAEGETIVIRVVKNDGSALDAYNQTVKLTFADGVSFDLGLPSTTDTAHALGLTWGELALTLGLPTTTDTALSPTLTLGELALALGLPSTASSALAVGLTFGGISLNLGQPTTTDSALAAGLTLGELTLSLGLPVTADTALAVTLTLGELALALGIPNTTDSPHGPLQLTWGALTAALGLPTTTDTAHAVTLQLGASHSPRPTTTTDTAHTQPHPGELTLPLGQPNTTDTALPLTLTIGGLILTLGQPSTTDTAHPTDLNWGPLNLTLGQPTETDTAHTVGLTLGALQLTLGQPATTDQAQPLTLTWGQLALALGQPTDTSTAHPTTLTLGELALQLGIPTDTSTPLPLGLTWGTLTIPLGIATETDTAHALALAIDIQEGEGFLIVVPLGTQLDIADNTARIDIQGDLTQLAITDNRGFLDITDNLQTTEEH